MLKYIFSTRWFFLIISICTLISGCRKKIDFDQESSSETSDLHPLQQYYPPWEPVGLKLTGEPIMLSADLNHLYIATKQNSYYRMYYMGLNLKAVALFYSSTARFTALEKGWSRMILATSGNSIGMTEFDQDGVYYNYPFFIQIGRRINDIEDDGLRFYPVGSYNQMGINPLTPNADKYNKSSQFPEGMPGIVGEVHDIDRLIPDYLAAGESILPSGHSIAIWNGLSWSPYTSIVDKKITDLQLHQDTIFIAGFEPGDFAIRKYANGNLITDSTLINTAGSSNDTHIKMFSIGNKLHAYGTINFASQIYRGVFRYENGKWSYLGKLGGEAKDVVRMGNFLYAITANVVKRFPVW